MDSFPNLFNPGGQGKFDVDSYLTAAAEAVDEGHKKLAIHLYISAYEADGIEKMVPSQNVLDGMRKAWAIACDINDKSSAETIFTELAPYSSPQQVDARVHQLQDMAKSQLEEMGVPSDRIERMSLIHTPEATAAGADPDFIDKFKGMMQTDESAVDTSEVTKKEEEEPEPAPFFPQWGHEHDESAPAGKDYDNIVGYDSELKKMCVYGFEAAGDEQYRQFIQETSEFHGLDGLNLYDPFMFYGPSRDDVLEFAAATAGEIGNPVLTLHVRMDDEGLWTIRLSGPFRRGLFGVSDPTDIPTPCTFIIENIDILQDFIKTSIMSEMQVENDPGAMRNARTYSEILGYIHAMLQKPDVFPIITSKDDVRLSSQFEDLFQGAQRIKIDYPNVEERKAVWKSFAMGHTSFSEIDIDELSRLSEGISRHDMLVAGRNAVRDAYQESLNNSEYRFVTINDVLFEMVPFVEQDDSTSYSAIEDAAAEAFVDELSDFTFEDAPAIPDDASAEAQESESDAHEQAEDAPADDASAADPDGDAAEDDDNGQVKA